MTRIGMGLALCSLFALGACGGGGGNGDDDTMPDASGVDGETICFPLPTDEDGDTISDTHENRPNSDVDGDGTPDSADTDSDGDGLLDSAEAGDTNPCTMPRDTDGDGMADFRELDADDNGINDADEPDQDLDGDGFKDFQDRDDDGDNIDDPQEIGPSVASPVDTDGDGTPDFQDTDSDGDGVPDRFEGLNDDDGDLIPAYLDSDADGDGIPDAIEAGANPGMPRDSDSDGSFDFLDVDSDNDGLPDDREDINANGVLDPGESDPRSQDTDGDTYPDVVEWAAGTNAQDSNCANLNACLSPDDFYFVLPYYDPEKTDDLDFSTDIIKADVLFECDTTGSMSGTINTLRTGLQTVIVPQVAMAVPNVAMGAAYFKDFPVSPFGGFNGGPDGYDLPFKLTQRITTVVTDVQAGLNRYEASGGGDGPESGMETLYQAVTGEGITWTVAMAGAVPKFNPTVGYDPARGHGLLGGAGFRTGALPIIVHATDIEFHDAPDYLAAGITEAHSRVQAVAAAQALGARFIGITSSFSAKTQLQQVARDTGAVVPPTAWGVGETLCHTGIGGAPQPPDATGLCPLVFDMDWSGSGVDLQVVEAISALVTYGTIDISGIAVSDPMALPQVQTAGFITAISPVPPAPPGAMIIGDVFKDVQPGAPVTFRVHARNTIVEQRREAQLFRVTIRVMGDMVTNLDERDVYVVVPGGGLDP